MNADATNISIADECLKEMEKPERLPLGCDSLDELLGGGVEHGIVTNVYGEAGSGKTNICVQAVSRAIHEGEGTAVFIDTEGGFSAERFLQIHGDEAGLEEVILFEPTTFDEQRDVIDGLEETVEEQDAGIIVVDSLVSLYRLHLDGDAQETNTELSKQFSTLSTIAREQEVPVIVTNQVYSEFDSDETVMVGRDIPAYWSKTLLHLKKQGDGRRSAELRKHRSRPEGVKTEFYITEESLASEEPEDGGMRIF